MTRRQNPPLPGSPFKLLLVEGGDERGVCQAIAGPAIWEGLTCRCADGRNDLVNLALSASLEPSFADVRSVGVVLEDDLATSLALAASTLAVFGATTTLSHGAFSNGSPRLGFFLMPDGASPGAVETLCRRAVRNASLAACVDQLVTCAGAPHALQARADKGWLRAYLGMTADPNLRFHQAFAAPDGIDPMHAAFDPLRPSCGSSERSSPEQTAARSGLG
jgi:hypothetical protein